MENQVERFISGRGFVRKFPRARRCIVEWVTL
jgi:hypothetical protein